MSINFKSIKKVGLLSLAYAILIGGVVYTFYVLGSRIRTRSYPVGSIEISTQYSTYLVGEEIKFTVYNKYNGPIYINNSCPAEPLEVFRSENGKWVHIHDTANKVCNPNDRTVEVPANGSVTSTFKDWPSLFNKVGKYRIATYVDYYGSIPYYDFEVVAKPPLPEIPVLLPLPQPTYTTSNSTGTSNATSENNESTTQQTTSQTTQNQTSQSTTQTLTVTSGGRTIGYITVTNTSTNITVTSITPVSGTYEISGNGSSRVEINFKSGGETQVLLRIRNGSLRMSINN
ncbi:hypothetical protein KC930_00370 [Candidatus Saccharibacteria bacterium]|nr:hypothetical protein [Candidatus Saccharibacteria bacterium]